MELGLPVEVAQHGGGTAAFEGFFLGEVTADGGLNAERGEEIIGDFNSGQLFGFAYAGEFVLERTIEGLVAGEGLEGLVVALVFPIGVYREGLAG